MKGVALIHLRSGRVRRAELHWYEAHGIGKKEFMEQIEWELRRDKTLSGSQDLLDQMAGKAIQDYERGRTKEVLSS